MQENDQSFTTTGYNGLQLVDPNLLTSSNYLQGLSPLTLNGLQQYQLNYNLQNLMLNQQQSSGTLLNTNSFINQANIGQQPNMLLLNQQNLLLNQQGSLNQLNQHVPSTNQQMYMPNLYRGQLPVQAFLIPYLPNGSNSKSNNKKSSKKRAMVEDVKKNDEKSKKTNQVQQIYKTKQINQVKDKINQQNKSLPRNEIIDNDSETDDDQLINTSDDEDESEESDLEENSIKSDDEEFEDEDDEDDDYEDMVHDVIFNDDSNQYSNNTINLNSNYSKEQQMSNLPDLSCIKKELPDNSRSRKANNEMKSSELKMKIEELKVFAKTFKVFRTANNITQDMASSEISRFKKCSQSKLCRFETFSKNSTQLEKNPKKLRIALQMKEVLRMYMEMKQNNADLLQEMTESRTRKKRVSFKPEIVNLFNDYFQQNSNPSPEEISELSEQIGHSEQEIKVWFNNKRQTLKRANNSKIDT